VRSSAIYSRKFNKLRDNDMYYTSSNQYLTSRNRTFAQNQYNFIRQGNAAAKPGTNSAVNNLYAAGGASHCEKYYISAATSFQYKWIDNNTYTVSVPAGYYDVNDLNTVLFKTMASNSHYLIVSTAFNSNQNVQSNLYYADNFTFGQKLAFLLQFGYSYNTSQVVLMASPADTTLLPSSIYTIPPPPQFVGGAPAWSLPASTATKIPNFIIGSDSTFSNAIGFRAGSYPATNTYSPGGQTTFYSTFSPGIKNFVLVVYKPNNSQFAQQGAVSASSLITRIKYDAITNNTVPYKKAYGTAVANALAYGISENAYTLKDKIGFPNIKTPGFKKGHQTCESSKCIVNHF
jgi:hypothetical protein